MKFLFFSDSHIKGTTPRNRKDNFFETLKNKFKEIKNISDALNIDYILHGGDWFDRPDISPAVVREFAVIIRSFGKPVYTVAGNHDVYGQNPETVGRTMLGIFEGIGIVILLNSTDLIVLEKDGTRVQLTGQSYRYDIDGENFKDFYIVKKRKDVNFAINMVHGMLLSKPFFEGIQYTLVDEIKETEADITISGHYHSGFGIIKIGSRYFANPGSLVRISNALSEIKRRPKIILIEIQDEIKMKEIELESALPGEDVLDRTQLEYSQERSLKLIQFYQGIESSCSYNRINLNHIINEIASKNDVSSEIKDEAVKRIAIAREGMFMGDDEEW